MYVRLAPSEKVESRDSDNGNVLKKLRLLGRVGLQLIEIMSGLQILPGE